MNSANFSSQVSGNNKIKLDVDVQEGFGPETITIQLRRTRRRTRRRY
jgi:hypothetical protein